jgi:hypothetical protein
MEKEKGKESGVSFCFLLCCMGRDVIRNSKLLGPVFAMVI